MSLTQSTANLPQPFRGSFDPPRLDLDVNPWDKRYFWTSVCLLLFRVFILFMSFLLPVYSSANPFTGLL